MSDYCAVQVARRPVGPGPEWVRDAWIGVVVRVLPEVMKLERCTDAISGESFGAQEVVLSPSRLAFASLRDANPQAYDWYKDNGYTSAPCADFMFDVGCLDSLEVLVRAS